MLGVGQGTVSLLASEGRLETVTLPNGAVRYTNASVLALGGVKDKAPAQGEGGHVGETMNQRQCTTTVLEPVQAGVIPLVPEERTATFSSGKLNVSGTMRLMNVGEFFEIPADIAYPWVQARKQGVSIKIRRIAGKLYAERVK